MGEVKLTATQREAMSLALDGDLHRWPGGFWAPANEPDRYKGQRSQKRGGPVPERFVGVRTIDALERRGLLERSHKTDAYGKVEEWRDPRRITPAGRAALQEATHDK